MTPTISVTGLTRRYRITGLLGRNGAGTPVRHQAGDFFTALSAAGLTGLLGALTVVLFAGGFTTMRRITV